MEPLFDLTAWREILLRAFSELGANLAGFLPSFVGALLILLVGWGISRALELVSCKALQKLGLDRLAERLGIAGLLERAEFELRPSQLAAKLLFWLVMLTFVLSSVETLGLTAVTTTIDRLIAFIPNVIGAVTIGVGGLLLGRFVAALVSSAAAAAGLLSAPRLGFLCQLLVVGLMAVLAAEQLGVATSVLVLPFTVALGAAGFAIGLAFALGARPVITHILAGHFLKQSLPRDASIEVDGERGMVERIGAVDTLLRNDDRAWSVPNAKLIEHVVVR